MHWLCFSDEFSNSITDMQIFLIGMLMAARCAWLILDEDHEDDDRSIVICKDSLLGSYHRSSDSKVKVVFREKEITYSRIRDQEEGKSFRICDERLVDYIYSVLFKGPFAAPWQRRVVNHLRRSARSLYHSCILKIPLAYQESLLRRFVCTTAKEIRDCYWKSSMRTGPEERKEFFELALACWKWELSAEDLASSRFLYVKNLGLSSDFSCFSNFKDVPGMLLLEALNRRLFEEVFDHIWIASLEDYHFVVHHPRRYLRTDSLEFFFDPRQLYRAYVVVRRELLCLDPSKARGVLQKDCFFHSNRDRSIPCYDDAFSFLRGHAGLSVRQLRSLADSIFLGGWRDVFPPQEIVPKSLKLFARYAMLKKVVLLKVYWLALTVLALPYSYFLYDVNPEQISSLEPFASRNADLMMYLDSFFKSADPSFFPWLCHSLERYPFLLLCVAMKNHYDIFSSPKNLFYSGANGYFTKSQLSLMEGIVNLF